MASIEEKVLATGLTIAANGSSDTWDALNFKCVEVEFSWKDADAADGTATLMRGLSASSLTAHAAAKTLGAASGSDRWTIEPFGGRFLRVDIAKGSNATGTITIRAVGKP